VIYDKAYDLPKYTHHRVIGSIIVHEVCRTDPLSGQNPTFYHTCQGKGQNRLRWLTETKSKLTLTQSGDGGPNPKLHMIY